MKLTKFCASLLAAATILGIGSVPSARAAGAVLTQFASRGTVTPGSPLYGGFELASTTRLFIAVRGPSLSTLGVSVNALSHPQVGLYSASGELLVSSNQCGGDTAEAQQIMTYYQDVRKAPLDPNDACLVFDSTPLAAGTYTFIISPDSSAAASSGEVLFETSPEVSGTTSVPTGQIADLYGLVTLNYGSGTATNNTAQVQFSSDNLKADSSGNVYLSGNLTGTGYPINCFLGDGAYLNEYYCASFSTGLELWFFALSDTWAITGTYEYCSSATSADVCASDGMFAPDGGVTGTIGGVGKSPSYLDDRSGRAAADKIGRAIDSMRSMSAQ